MRTLRIALTGFALVVLALFANWAANWLFSSQSSSGLHDPPRSKASHGKEPAVIEIGDIWESPTQTIRVPFRNSTASILEVSDVRLSCGCVKIDPRSFSVSPHAQFEATATVDLTHRTPDDLGRSSRPLVLTFEPLVRTPNSQSGSFQIRGTIRSRATSDRLDLHFGDSCIKGAPAVCRTLAVTVHVPARTITARTEPNLARVQFQKKDGTDGQFTLAVEPDLELEAKSYATKLVVGVVDDAGTEQYGFSIPVTFDILPAKPLFPRRVFLPTGPVGKPVQTRLHSSAEARTSIRVEAIESSSNELTAEIERGTKDDAPSIFVTVTATKRGPGTVLLVVLVRHVQDDGTERIPIEVNYVAD
jgi:hypothetical protein